MPRLTKQQIKYLIAGAALMVALLVSYKALAALLLLIFVEPPLDMRDKRRAAIKEQVARATEETKEAQSAERDTAEAKTSAGERASKDVDLFIDGDW